MYEEIREMERLQFPTTFEKQWRSLRLEVNHIVEMWDPLGGVINTNFFATRRPVGVALTSGIGVPSQRLLPIGPASSSHSRHPFLNPSSQEVWLWTYYTSCLR
ncbi:hypothetical protein EDB86DRAFT_2838769 [Lactarius hatsudake]|nr:hypothetical protein EDB86DRAFT_2838769 [Lactarius hatsudake]